VIAQILRGLQSQPDYREGRSHSDFLVSLHDLGVKASFVEVERAVADAARRMALEVDDE
jgi:hypothetical protein